MLSRKVLDYIRKVLEDGFPAREVEDALLKKGYDKGEIDEAISSAVRKIKSNKGLKQKIENIVHSELLSKTDRVLVKFTEKMLRKGYFPDQIEKILVNEGYDRDKAGKIISIIEKRLGREEKLHEVVEEIVHHKAPSGTGSQEAAKARYNTEIKHHEWIKLGLVIATVIIGVVTALFKGYGAVVNAGAIAAALAVSLPSGAYFMHHVSLWIHRKEFPFREGFRYLLMSSILYIIVNSLLGIGFAAVLFALIIYFFTHTLAFQYQFPKGKAFIISLSVLVATAIATYIMLIGIGLLVGFYLAGPFI
jgi:hypothetical protein